MILAYNTTAFARSCLSNRLTACRLKMPFNAQALKLYRVSASAAGTIPRWLSLANLNPSHLHLPAGRRPYSNLCVMLVPLATCVQPAGRSLLKFLHLTVRSRFDSL